MKFIVACTVALIISACSGGSEESPAPSDAVDAQQVPQDVKTGEERSTDDGVEADSVEIEAPAPNSYRLTVTLEKGPGITCAEDIQAQCFEGKTCCLYEYERDLTGLDTKFAFGSTHIAPAISLAMTDTMYTPTFAVITLNFGIIIGTSDKPPATAMAGEYDFGGFEPEVEVTIHNKEYSSKVEGSQGTFVVTDWAAEKGGKWAGTVQGTIIQNTAKAEKLRAQVDGSFDFILPEPAGGQGGG
jgi:hypothetical protein